MRRQPGVAMAVVLVMILIFASLILAVVLSSTLAFKSASRERNRTIALQTAYAGVQTALYWMNYRGQDMAGNMYDYYPCTATSPAVAYDPDYRYLDPDDLFTRVRWKNSEVWFTPVGNPDAKCCVEFQDSTETSVDRIIATGKYRGATARVSVNIRGDNGEGNPGHNAAGRWIGSFQWNGSGWVDAWATWGVPESFNKHAIYASQVVASGAAVTIQGNVAALTGIPFSSPRPSGQYTETRIPNASFFDAVQFDTGGCVLPRRLADNEFACVFERAGPGLGMCTDLATGETRLVTVTPGNEVAGVSYDGTDFIFADTEIAYPFWVKGNMRIGSPAPTFHRYVRVDDRFELPTGNSMKTDYDGHFVLEISAGGSGVLNVYTGTSVHGDFMIRNLSTFAPITQIGSGTTIYGSLGCEGEELYVAGASIIATDSHYGAALFTSNGNGDSLLQLRRTPAITIGATQKAAIVSYGTNGHAARMTMSGVDFTLNPINAIGSRPTAVCYSPLASARLSFLAAGGTSIVTGLVYVSGGSKHTPSAFAGHVTFDDASEIRGVLVANGTVYLGTHGRVTYDPTPFKTSPYGSIFQGFYGGRRVYLPVPGSWRVE